jgi:hypothetical protein
MRIRKPEEIVQAENHADEEIDGMAVECCPDCARNQSAWEEFQSKRFILVVAPKNEQTMNDSSVPPESPLPG